PPCQSLARRRRSIVCLDLDCCSYIVSFSSRIRVNSGPYKAKAFFASSAASCSDSAVPYAENERLFEVERACSRALLLTWRSDDAIHESFVVANLKLFPPSGM